jgi:hypothetical protein
MKTLPLNSQLGSNEEIASSVIMFAPSKRFDTEQAEYTLSFIERSRGYKLLSCDRENILNLVESHLEACYD